MEIQKYNNIILNCDIECILVGSDVWFRGKDIAKALGYENTTKTIRDHVEEEDKSKLEELGKNDSFSPTFNDKITIYK